MAPGARPLGEKAAAVRDARKAEDKAHGGRPRGGKPFGGKAHGDKTRDNRKPPTSGDAAPRPRPTGRGKPRPKGPKGS